MTHENAIPGASSEKFKNVPVEKDTKIVFRVAARFEPFDVMYEKWIWEGIGGESVIFASDDIASISDADLEALIRESPLIRPDSEVTIKRTEGGYSFVNFNFEGS